MMEKLGEGDAGYNFRAQWRGMPVVAKVLKNPKQEHDFAHEVAVLSRLRHPNLVQFLGACLDHTAGPQVLSVSLLTAWSLTSVSSVPVLLVHRRLLCHQMCISELGLILFSRTLARLHSHLSLALSS